VNWWKNDADGKYYVFLPSNADLSKLNIAFDDVKSITVNGKKVESGKTTDAFKKGGEFQIEALSKAYTLVIMKSDNIPAIYIETESGSLDNIHESKQNKESAQIAAYENGKQTVNAALSYIKGRGNSTWAFDKKPYNIKFKKKIDLFGMGKAKKWSLIASADEQSLIRNKFVYDFSDEIGLMYSSKSQHVDLYINGDYLGNYLLCESVGIGSSRVDIADLEEMNEAVNPGVDVESCTQAGNTAKEAGYIAGSKKWVEIPNDPADISGGYLIEFEQANRYHKELSGFVSNLGQPVTMKSPECASKAQIDYISNFYQQFEDAVRAEDGKNSLGKHYSDYVDMDSLVKMYLIQETMMNLDAGTTSFYFYKDAQSDKLVASPVWDFDFSLGKEYERYDLKFTEPDHWWACIDYITDTRDFFGGNNYDIPTILNLLCRHDDFMQLVEKEWQENFAPKLKKNQVSYINKLSESLYSSAIMDAIRWNRYETTDAAKNLNSYKKEVKIVTDFLTSRIKFLDVGFSEKGAKVTYDANGGVGVTIDANGYVVGDSAKVRESTFESETIYYTFDSWNTEKDGSGTTYHAGDKIKLESSNVILYAQWREVPKVKAIFKGIFDILKGLIIIVLSRFTAVVK
ncbi:MAG: CotH kinase family protein, partial [Ruminococcus sp.]|nr:CotH kinase family protein [Ruminococcus sp.]